MDGKAPLSDETIKIMLKTIFIFSTVVWLLFAACATVRTEQAAAVTPQPTKQISPLPTANPHSTIKPYGTPEAKGERMKLSGQPLEIRLFFARNYNLIEDPKTGKYADESSEWGKYIEIEAKEIDLNHDGINERMIVFLTDPFGRRINPESYDVYFFRQDEKKWTALNSEAFYDIENLRFVKAEQKGEFDEIWAVKGDSAANEQGKETSIDIISVNRVIDGKYREVECRELKSGKPMPKCPSSKD